MSRRASTAATDTAIDRVRGLFDDKSARAATVVDGYLDVLAASPPATRTFAQQLMRTRGYAWIYQAGRPVVRRLISSPRLGRDADRRLVASLLRLEAGSTVADIGCGPGNFTGWFGTQVDDGLAVGIDASQAMLDRAVTDNGGPNVAYVRGDAGALPLVDQSVDAVSCLAALYLINDPQVAVREMVRVLKPGGRLVILTSVAPSVPGLGAVIGRIGGIRVFGAEEVTGWLRELGLVDVEQSVAGLAQTVWGIKPDDRKATT